MEDNVSIKSSDSVTTSGEYEIVPELNDCIMNSADGGSSDVNACISIPGSNTMHKAPAKSPTLNIANNGDFNDLEKNLHEVIHELDISPPAGVIQGTTSAAAIPTATTLGQGKHIVL